MGREKSSRLRSLPFQALCGTTLVRIIVAGHILQMAIGWESAQATSAELRSHPLSMSL